MRVSSSRSPAARVCLCAALVLAAALGPPLLHGSPQPPTDALDVAFAEFWSASSDKELARAASRVVAAGAAFDDVYERLRRGRPYARDVQTGDLTWQTLMVAGVGLPTTVIVPGVERCCSQRN